MSKIAEKVMQYRYSLAIWTDRADCIIDKSAPLDEDKLLEIRCFDDSGEYRAYRSVVNKDFIEREITDDKAFDGFFNEFHYLDIDEKQSKGTVKFTTGGGTYHLPEEVSDKQKLKVRNYYKFDENGIARPVDWRLVGFADKKQ